MLDVLARWRREREAGTRLTFAVHADGTTVGGAELQPKGETAMLSWWLYAGHRGRGYATRAARILVDHAFTHLGVRRVEAQVDPRNVASQRVATRSGLRREGLRRLEPGMTDRPDAPGGVLRTARRATRRSASRRGSGRCSTRSSPASARSASCSSATVTAGC